MALARSLVPDYLDQECAYCGAAAETLDHVIPWRHGGRATIENLVTACLRCNKSKSDRTPEEWLLAGLVATTPEAGSPSAPRERRRLRS